MPLLKPCVRDEIDPALVPLWDQLQTEYPQFRNLWRTMAHAPSVFQHIWSGYRALNQSDAVTQREFELVVFVVSTLTTCSYCVSHHAPRARQQGLTDAQIHAIESIKLTDDPVPTGLDVFDSAERRLVELAYHIVWAGTYASIHDVHPSKVHEARRAIHAGLQSERSPRQIEELTWRIVQCAAFNWHNDFLEIEIEATE